MVEVAVEDGQAFLHHGGGDERLLSEDCLEPGGHLRDDCKTLPPRKKKKQPEEEAPKDSNVVTLAEDMAEDEIIDAARDWTLAITGLGD